MTGRDVYQDVFRRHATSVNVPGRLSSLGRMDKLACWAGHLAQALLQEPLPRRWAHVQGVADRARSLAPVLGGDADLVEAAAWLHDIGYAPGLAVTGFHPLDGARYLRDARHADVLLCRLVAHHSCALIEAEERGARRRPGPRVRAPAGCPWQRADVLRHDHQPGRRARAGRAAARRDPSPLRLRAPGEPVNPPRHADDPPRSRAGPRQSRPNRIGPQGNARQGGAAAGLDGSGQVPRMPERQPFGTIRTSDSPWRDRRANDSCPVSLDFAGSQLGGCNLG